MVEFTICPFCGQDTRKLILKTENVQSESEDTEKIESVLHYTRCENCDKVWIEHETKSDQ
jgi:hypothetical protein